MMDASRFKETAAKIKSLNDGQAPLSRLEEAICKLRGLKDGATIPMPLELIDTTQNRRKETEGQDNPDFRQLVDSINEVGLLQPPVITLLSGTILCVSGHRRIAALRSLGHEKTPCILRHLEKMEIKEAAQLIENMVRKALQPIDVAEGLDELRRAGYSQARLEDLLGRDRKTIGRFQKIANWPIEAKEIIRQHPDKFRTSTLFPLASRTITKHDLLTALKIKAGTIKNSSKFKKHQPILIRVEEYFSTNRIEKTEQTLILNALKGLGVLKDGT